LPTQEGIFQHFKRLADISPRPVILYNVPARTARSITAETCLRLAEHQNVIGIKEASKDLNQAMEIARYKPADFSLISGDDMMTLPLVSVGANGVISVMANALPGVFSKMVHLALEGKFEAARDHLFTLLDVNALLYEEGNPAGVKQALCELGICQGSVRLPLVQASEGLVGRIKEAIRPFYAV
jgi:4-hydroxy-tetrahydrodipicolinate synthase